LPPARSLAGRCVGQRLLRRPSVASRP